jgi:hypothetical protein
MRDYKTAEVIARETDHLEGIAERRAINKAYRDQDQSNLYPILGKFNVTDRAIRRVNKLERENGAIGGIEYCYVLEGEISRIVNHCE